ncbi:hypothetical protein HYU14_00950 [Candidatus Woesearchaeota archaeon]|nr:hypothetical protein [Candidatus Woesearchaeota archaeon]
MGKRGEMSTHWLLYMTALIVASAILIFGYSSFTKVNAQNCLAQSLVFEQDFKAAVEKAVGSEGSVFEKSFQIPCGVDRVYFVDTDNADTSDEFVRSVFVDMPLLWDSLQPINPLDMNSPRTGKNMFFSVKGIIQKAAFGGNISIEFPYFQCFKVVNGRMEMFLEENATRVKLRHKDKRFDCGAREAAVQPTPADVDTMVTEAVPLDDCTTEEDFAGPGVSGAEGDKSGITEYIKGRCKDRKLKRVKDNVGVKRVISVHDKTVVELKFRTNEGEIEEFVYIEFLPKECVEKLRRENDQDDEGAMEGELTRLETNRGQGQDSYDFRFENDPLLMWGFPILGTKERKVVYRLNNGLSESCQEKIKGIPFFMENITLAAAQQQIPNTRSLRGNVGGFP